MAQVTAKVKVTDRRRLGDEEVTVSFGPDYDENGRNAAWAAATPALSLVMTVNGKVANQFEMGQTGTLTFEMDAEPQESGEQSPSYTEHEDGSVPEQRDAQAGEGAASQQ